MESVQISAASGNNPVRLRVCRQTMNAKATPDILTLTSTYCCSPLASCGNSNSCQSGITYIENNVPWSSTTMHTLPSDLINNVNIIKYAPLRGRKQAGVLSIQRLFVKCHCSKCLITPGESLERKWNASVPLQLKMTISQFSDASDDQAYQWAERKRLRETERERENKQVLRTRRCL